MITWTPARLAIPPLTPLKNEERGPTLLMIEDDRAIAEMYRHQLALDGFNVALAFDGEEGLTLASQVEPDLVLLDVRLPGIQGFGVLERLRSDPRLSAIPVVLLSNYGDPRMVERGLQLGARDYLIKSRTTPMELSLKVRALLGSETSD